MPGGWVYILASRYRGTLYTGVTSDIARRAWQHREGSGSRFAARYGDSVSSTQSGTNGSTKPSDAKRPSKSGAANGRSN
jgi:hypothetical protein